MIMLPDCTEQFRLKCFRHKRLPALVTFFNFKQKTEFPVIRLDKVFFPCSLAFQPEKILNL